MFNHVCVEDVHNSLLLMSRLSQCEMAELKARLEENEVLLHGLQQRSVFRACLVVIVNNQEYYCQAGVLRACSRAESARV